MPLLRVPTPIMSTAKSGSHRFRASLATVCVLSIGLCAGIVIERNAFGPADPTAPEVRDVAQRSDRVSVTGAGRPIRSSPILPIPVLDDCDPARVALGRRLFHDAALSLDGTTSCASCHDISKGGDDGRKHSIGVDGATGAINAPTVLNSRFNFRQFWNGRAEDLESQIEGPLLHPTEMATTWEELVAKLRDDPDYASAFRAAYGHPPDASSVRDAIATFERSLITPGSPFDRWLMGEEDAISDTARAGYELFVSIGCITCHQGVNVGGNMFQPIGKGRLYFDERGGDVSRADLGRFAVTGDERDMHVFRVAPLRNVALTAPYLHDGSAATLAEAVQVMARHQLGEDLSNEELSRIVAFLETLTGDVQAVYEREH